MSNPSQPIGKGDEPPAPDVLRQALLESAADPARLEAVCRAHRDLIRQHFASWCQVPPELRESSERMKPYVEGLIAVAQCFANRLGDPSLMRTLAGPPGGNPVDRWQQTLDQARQEMSQLEYREAGARLTDLAIDVGRLNGSAVDAYLPVILGLLGECCFQTGQAEHAAATTRQALDLVRAAGDVDGIAAYLGNLYEMYRYLGRGEEAADHAEELAQVHEQQSRPAEARRYRNQARLVRRGEPLLRIVVDIGGKRYELDEVPRSLEGSARFLFERNRLTLRPAEALTEQGEQAGAKGEFESALQLFLEAIEADPFAPQPVYESALTYLYLGRAGDAVAAYDRTEELAPGWFRCRSEGWLARQIVAGRYDLDDFKALHAFGEGAFDPRAKRQLAERAVARRPELAMYHYESARVLLQQRQAAEAEAAFRRALECVEEPDLETRLCIELVPLTASAEEKRRLCERALKPGGNLVAAATATLLLARD